MTDATTEGKLLVGLQFTLLVAIVLAPRAVSIRVPGLAYVTGYALFLAGLVVVVLGLRALGSSLTANPVPLASGTLVTTGLYSRVRHPIYAGLLLATFGMALDSWNPIRGVLWLLLAALLTYKMRFEEGLLVAKYPGYRDYAARVPALVPRLRG